MWEGVLSIWTRLIHSQHPKFKKKLKSMFYVNIFFMKKINLFRLTLHSSTYLYVVSKLIWFRWENKMLSCNENRMGIWKLGFTWHFQRSFKWIFGWWLLCFWSRRFYYEIWWEGRDPFLYQPTRKLQIYLEIQGFLTTTSKSLRVQCFYSGELPLVMKIYFELFVYEVILIYICRYYT